MSDKISPSIVLVINSRGIEKVQILASSWEEEAVGRRIYDRIRPSIRQIDQVLVRGEATRPTPFDRLKAGSEE